jgi:DHA1 family bicyclomycin/chloramphenicol resistance-like MFS transporter
MSAPPRPAPDALVISALLTALVALGQISSSIYIPSMPSLVADLATTPDHVSLTLSLFLFGFAVGQLVFGPLSDRFGRRPVLLGGLVLYLGASVLCLVAPSIDALIAGRFAQGCAASVGPVLGRAIVRDVHGPDRSATVMAYIGAALAISPAIGPIIGGYLQTWFGWRAAFVFLAAVGSILAVATHRLLAETRPDSAGGTSLHRQLIAYATLVRSQIFWAHTLAVAFIFSGLMAYTVGGPFVFIERLRLSPEHYGMLAVFTVASFLVGSLLAGRLTSRVGVERMVRAGMSVSAAGGALLLSVTLVRPLSVVGIVLPMMAFTFGLALVMASGIAGAMAHFPSIAGAASALLGFVQMIVAGIATVIVGAFPDNAALAMALTIAVTAAAGLALFSVLARRAPDRRRSPS